MPKKSNAELFEEAERELTKEAIGETEQEIFDDALGEAPDENDGDMSLEQMDDDDLVGDDDADEGEADSEEAEEAAGEGEEGEQPTERQADRRAEPGDRQERRGIPSDRLRQESEARRVAEAERDAERARLRELEARLRLIEQGPREQPKPAEKPDMFADPEAWAKSQREEIERGFEERRVNGSFAEAAEQHGDKFNTAFRALQASGDPSLVQGIVKSHNPGRALMGWHDRQALLSEIGNDPAAYRERVRADLLKDPEARKAIITGMREDAQRGDGGQPRTRTRLPPSLSSASGGQSHRGREPVRSMKTTEQEIADSVWDD